MAAARSPRRSRAPHRGSGAPLLSFTRRRQAAPSAALALACQEEGTGRDGRARRGGAAVVVRPRAAGAAAGGDRAGAARAHR